MNKTIITEQLGLFGWEHIEPVVLAALARETPMLLIGKHGCAKSYILERLAESLKLNCRLYNASLINYDDLVGIPIPTNNNTTLEYISNPSSIWDAEVVFIDEINRTKPELQNKLFPIIYDKRVQGINLTKLKYRWAAMNPPFNEEDEDNDLSYLGASKLDPALADRFPFIIEVPSWDELSDDDKSNILTDQFNGKSEINIDIHKIIDEINEEYNKLVASIKDDTREYIMNLMQLLNNNIGYVSPRRATMMQETLIAIHASRIVIERYLKTNQTIAFKETALLHILVALPDLANRSINKEILYKLCNTALELSKLDENFDKRVMLIKKPLDRLKFAIKNKAHLDNNTLNKVIPSCISKLDPFEKRIMSLICYLKFRDNVNLDASLIETLIFEIKPILEMENKSDLFTIPDVRVSQCIVALLNTVKNEPYYNYLNNILYSFYPNGYSDASGVSVLFNTFKTLWGELINE